MNSQYDNQTSGNISAGNYSELPTLNDSYNSNPLKREIHDTVRDDAEYSDGRNNSGSKGRISLIAAIAVVALLIIAGVCYFFLSDPDNRAGETVDAQPAAEAVAGTEDIEFADDPEEGAAAESPTPYDYTAMVCYHRLTPADLRGCPKAELEMMLATIYARRGYSFPDDEEMATFFSRFSWYTPSIDQLPSELSDIERANVAMLNEALK